MTVAMTPPIIGVRASFKTLQLGQADVPIAGRSIQTLLNEMRDEGWILSLASVNPNPRGTICRYMFDRPLNCAQTPAFPSQ